MDEHQEDINGLDYLPRNLFVQICISIFEEMLDQLLILKIINHWPEVGPIEDTYKTIEERYSDNSTQSTECTVDNELYFKPRCAYIVEVVKTTVHELKENGSYSKLLNLINEFKMMESDGQELKEDTLRNEAELKKYERIFQEDRQYYHQAIDDCMTNIGKIKDEIEDFKIESEMKLNYVNKWENSKIEMTEILLSRNEQEKMDQLKKLDASVYKEIRVHQEILAAYYEMQQDLESQIDTWKIKYNNDLKELDKKISGLKEEQQSQIDKMLKLKEVYSSRQKEIDSFKRYRIKQQEIRLDLEKRNRAATKIQAWWRGTMVRKGFGKFRKKKDKKAKKKSSEQKTKT